MNDLTKIEPEVSEVMAKKPEFLKITKQDESDLVASYLINLREIRKRIADFFKPDIEKAHQLHKSLISKMNQVDTEPAKAEMTYRRMLSDWNEQERRRIAEEQRKLDEKARKDAMKVAKKEGDEKLAEQIQNGKVPVVSMKTPEPIQKTEGISTREYWKAEVQDLMALVKAVASGKASIEYLTPNMQVLNKIVSATKGNISIPGVIARKETGINVRTK